jgi:hypothetical protein
MVTWPCWMMCLICLILKMVTWPIEIATAREMRTEHSTRSKLGFGPGNVANVTNHTNLHLYSCVLQKNRSHLTNRSGILVGKVRTWHGCWWKHVPSGCLWQIPGILSLNWLSGMFESEPSQIWSIPTQPPWFPAVLLHFCQHFGGNSKV